MNSRYRKPIILGLMVILFTMIIMIGLSFDSITQLTASAQNGELVNLALGMTTSQSSQFDLKTEEYTRSSNAVDGNTSGIFTDQTSTHTMLEYRPWWQVDLGEIRDITYIDIWNRADCCSERLSDFFVFVSDVPFVSEDADIVLNQPGVNMYFVIGESPQTNRIEIHRTGRYVRIQLLNENYLTLSEVEVWGRVLDSPTLVPSLINTEIPTPVATEDLNPTPPVEQINLALGKLATQSSVLQKKSEDYTKANNAVDGNVSGHFDDKSLAHTKQQNNPWWQVDLGEITSISEVKIWNRTDCCIERLSDFFVFVSNEPFSSDDPDVVKNQPGVMTYFHSGIAGRSTSTAIDHEGRYIRVQLKGKNFLALSEVEVWGTNSALPLLAPSEESKPANEINFALGKIAMQSSLYRQQEQEYIQASNAVDGNSSGEYSDKSLTHTKLEHQPWWQVDLGESKPISLIKIWNRADCCGDRLSDFYVFLSNDPFTSDDPNTIKNQPGVSTYFVGGTANRETLVEINNYGRYVRVQLRGKDYLTLAEVEVWGYETLNANMPETPPTQQPTAIPTEKPTEVPTEKPTEAPTQASTKEPTSVPTQEPTQAPTTAPTEVPTEKPTQVPTQAPTLTPIPTQPPVYNPPPTNMVAFPGAEGFGANAVGGRGGQVFEVTNLNDSGTGSLRACIEASGPRICVFRTGGTIEVKSQLSVKNPYITIAGQTAPGDGITLRHSPGATFYSTMTIETHDVIMRYITIRRGPGGGGDALGIYREGVDQVYNVIIDHCSLSWGVDEVANSWYAPHDYTIQWSIFAEGLNCSTHPKGCHSMGFMLGSYAANNEKTIPGAYNLSFHHNLMAHNGSRTPLVKSAGLASVVNNLIYNTDGTFSHVDMENQLAPVLVDYVNNYFKYGPSTPSGKEAVKMLHIEPIGAEVYISDGNILELFDGRKLYGTAIVDPNVPPYLVSQQIGATNINVTSAEQAYSDILGNVGSSRGLTCDGSFYWRRDAHDTRIVNDVKNLTGSLIDDPSQVGGWLTLNQGTPCQDSDHDGMPDQWETKYGFNPNDASDNHYDADNDGYTNLEEYLNGTNP